MVCRMLYLCLGPVCSHLTMDPHCTAKAGGNSSTQAGSCVLTFEKPNSTQQWNTSPARGGKGSSFGEESEGKRVREKICGRKKKKGKKRKEEKITKEIPHTLQMREMSFKAAPSLHSFLLFCVQAEAAESALHRALARIQLSEKICFQYECFLWTQETAIHTKQSLWV